MGNQSLPSLTFQILPKRLGAAVGLTVFVPNHQSAFVPAKRNLIPFAAAVVRLKIEALRQPDTPIVEIDARQFPENSECFDQAWNFIKNAIRKKPTVKAGEALKAICPWLEALEKDRSNVIQITLAKLPVDNLVFRIMDSSGISRVPSTEEEHLRLFDFLTGKIGCGQLLDRMGCQPTKSGTFCFGDKSTGTTVVHRFPDGLPANYIHCSLTDQPYSVPREIELLIDRAHMMLPKDAPGVENVRDSSMLAPLRIEKELDMDTDAVFISIRFAVSSYRHYAAFAFAEFLATHSKEFVPLLAFVRDVPDITQPGAASCSMGVRVLVETADDKIIVAHRSHKVKVNPDIWSVSANEGIRQSLVERGRDCSDLLTLAVFQALKKELKIEGKYCQQPVLLSIYRNSFNQWGAGFTIKTDLSSDRVIAGGHSAHHMFEHQAFAALPLDIEQCGRAMRDLGERWYGGALETICQFFAWRFITDYRFPRPEDVAAILSREAGGTITPIDQPKSAMVVLRADD